MRRKIFAAAAVLWMIVICSFSAKVSEDSEEMSRSVGMLIGKAVIKEYKEWPGKRQAAFAAKIDYPVRKAAHASEYAILGILLTGAILDIRKPWKRQLPACFLIGAAYAASDEFHQLFVPGRSGQIRDVMIDSAGVAAGIILACLAIKAFQCRKPRKIEGNCQETT